MPGLIPCDERLTVLWLHAQPSLMAFLCGSVRDRTLADDLAQDVALAVTKQFATYDPGRPFIGWVLGIAHHKVVDHFRNAGPTRRVIADPAVLAQLASAAVELGDDLARRREALNACLGGLDGRNWQVVKLHYHEDLAGEAIATRLGLTVAHVWTVLSRTRSVLKRCIEKRLQAEPA